MKSNEVKMVSIPKGSAFADLYKLDLHLPLKEAADRITAHNRKLIERTRSCDFKSSEELDASGNHGHSNLHFLAEQVVLYPEGWVPFEVAEECRETCELLVRRLMELDEAPIEELDDYRYRLRNFFDAWMLNYSRPRMTPFYYRKRVFRLLNDVNEALMRLHKSYLLADLRKDVKRRKKNGRKWSKIKRNIFDKIDELRAQKMSVPHALAYLRTTNYAIQMKGATDATWKSDYYAYKRGE